MTGWSKNALKIRMLFLAMGFILGAGSFFLISSLNAPKEKVVAVVDGTKIKESEINDIMRNKSGAYTLEKHIDNLVIENAAKSYGISVTTEEVDKELKRKITMEYNSESAFLESLSLLKKTYEDVKEELRLSMLFDKVAAKDIKVSSEEINKYYKDHKDKFTVPEKRRVSEIVLKTESEATLIKEQLVNGADFKGLASEKSIGPGKEKGGDRGFIIKGSLNSLQPDVEKVVFQLNQGDISPIIKASDGFHIVMVNEIVPKYEPSFETIKDIVELKVKLEKCKPFIEILKDLRKAGKIEIMDQRFKK
ncbi:MAG TPA: peptidyl-prolyl cis-trans isomerase [Pseudobacteroides sp.]|uniref:peptidylprolyl isomerase n=1 Tax=Pseudobacteroides sp. TaxID=1968840 RepID=UPI002F92DF33